MLMLLKDILFPKPVSAWVFDKAELSKVPIGATIVANYGFGEPNLTPEWTKLDADLWASEKFGTISNREISMPFATLESTTF
jgi:hypothetical protein